MDAEQDDTESLSGVGPIATDKLEKMFDAEAFGAGKARALGLYQHLRAAYLE